MKKTISIQDIANSLGLSRNTVSKALNGQHVPEKTRKLVLDKAKELNFKSMNYLNDSINKNYRILLLSGKPLSNINYYLGIIQSLENYCYDNNYQLFQYIFNKNYSSFEGIIEYLKNFNIDGIVCIESFDHDFIKQILKLDFPICFIDFNYRLDFQSKKFDIVESDNYFSVLNLVNKIIKEKHKRNFSFVGDYKHCLSFYKRYSALNNALFFNNLAHNKENDILLDDSFEYGNPNKLKFEILNKVSKIDCFVCANDYIARSIINALKSLGKKVPQDVLVIGYDDANEATNASPNITTISVDKKAIGQTAIKTLIIRIEDKNIASKIITIDSKIIERESTNN